MMQMTDANEDFPFVSLRNTIADGAGVCSGLWLSYTAVMSYLAVAIGGITARDLLLAKPNALPLIGTKVPLAGFGWLVPPLFLVLHCYVLLHFVLLALKVELLQNQFSGSGVDSDTQERLRLQLPINILVQFLAGPRASRTRFIGFLLRSVLWVSLVFAPVALLVLLETQLLPYHLIAMSDWQCGAVILDLIIIWLLWPVIVKPKRTGFLPDIKWTGFILLTLSTICVLWIYFSMSLRGDIVYFGKLSKPFSIALVRQARDGNRGYLTSSRLVVEHFAATEKGASLSLAWRRLDDAVLTDANFSRFDLAFVDLRGAQLFRSDFQGANLADARLEGANLDNALLRGTTLDRAHLAGATLHGAQLQGATLQDADLRGANLENANLQGANLDGAHLEGALLDGALLQGAVLDRAEAERTDKSDAYHGAKLEGASLLNTFIWKASLNTENLLNALIEVNGTPNRVCTDPLSDCPTHIDTCELQKELDKDLPDSDLKKKNISIIITRLTEDVESPTQDDSHRWSQRLTRENTPDAYADYASTEWSQLGCNKEGSHFVVEGLAHSLMNYSSPMGHNWPAVDRLKNRLLDESCIGSRGLSSEIRTSLRDLTMEPDR